MWSPCLRGAQGRRGQLGGEAGPLLSGTLASCSQHAQRLLLQVQPPPQGQEVVTQVLHLPDQLSHGHLQAWLFPSAGAGLRCRLPGRGPFEPTPPGGLTSSRAPCVLLLGQLASAAWPPGSPAGGGQLPSPAVLQSAPWRPWGKDRDTPQPRLGPTSGTGPGPLASEPPGGPRDEMMGVIPGATRLGCTTATTQSTHDRPC